MRLRTMLVGEEVSPEVDATPAAIRAALYPAELWNGTEVELRPHDLAAPRLIAVSAANPFDGPEDQTEFFLGLEEAGVYFGEVAERRVPREEVLVYFLRFVAGDAAWLDDFVWAESVDGRRTGRYRARAV